MSGLSPDNAYQKLSESGKPGAGRSFGGWIVLSDPPSVDQDVRVPNPVIMGYVGAKFFDIKCVSTELLGGEFSFFSQIDNA
jgi:hypothetical protein